MVVANLMIEDVEERALETSTAPHISGSTMSMTPSQPFPRILLILSWTTSIALSHLSIKFMVEKEKDGQLAFLDVQLCREDDVMVSTSVYHKATHTNQYLSFRSHH